MEIATYRRSIGVSVWLQTHVTEIALQSWKIINQKSTPHALGTSKTDKASQPSKAYPVSSEHGNLYSQLRKPNHPKWVPLELIKE